MNRDYFPELLFFSVTCLFVLLGLILAMLPVSIAGPDPVYLNRVYEAAAISAINSIKQGDPERASKVLQHALAEAGKECR